MRIDGARALVTGASSGIGAETAVLLAKRGVTVLAVGRDTTALTALTDRTGGRCLAVDLAEPDAAARVAEWAGAVDLLVGNAGVGFAGDLNEMPADRLHQVIAVNLTAHLALTRLLLPPMRKARRGHLVFVTSIAGRMGVADEAVYSASKAGLSTFADAIRLAHAPDGIGVSVVVPGVVDTKFFDRRGRPYDRRSPRPVPAAKVAAALVAAVEHNRPEVFVPAWLRFPARLNGMAPALVAKLQRKFG